MDYAAVSQTVKKFENKIKKDKLVSVMSETIANVLKEEENVEC